MSHRPIARRRIYIKQITCPQSPAILKIRINYFTFAEQNKTPMYTVKGLARFLEAQNHTYLKALSEIRSGKKTSHWMWYVFPQLKGLGKSDMAQFYGIESLKEAEDYLAHPVLGKHLVAISDALLAIEGRTANEIFGSPDDLKLCSSMTLFAAAANAHPVFQAVLEKYYGGRYDSSTRLLLQQHKKDQGGL